MTGRRSETQRRRDAEREEAQARVRALAEQCREAEQANPTWRFTDGKRTHMRNIYTGEWEELK